MGNNVGIAIFIFQALLALFAFFVTAPMTLNAISLFGVQKRFAEEMIKLGVVKEKDVKNMQTKKQIVGVLISLVVIGALCYSCYRRTGSCPWRYDSACVHVHLFLDSRRIHV